MKEEDFNLNLCNWQYTIKYHDTSSFVRGEQVFLKSNPEHLMIICDITRDKITTTWKTAYGDTQYYEFPPECILQYKYAGLITGIKTFSISLN